MSFFTVSQLSAGYNGKGILDEVEFSLEAGEIVGILGVNGCGKTTLLKSVCGILPHSGNCTLDGTVLEGLSPKKLGQLCSYIPQRSGIVIDISALDVVLMGFNPKLGLLERPDRDMIRRAEDALRLVGLDGFGERNYLHLSEGQKQLCILARTLIADVKLLLMDEPESALDFTHRSGMLSILRQRIEGRKQAVLVALHDPGLALNRCDRLLLLENGRITDCITPAEDSQELMEEVLGRLYGSVSLARVKDRNGREHLVMLRDET